MEVRRPMSSQDFGARIGTRVMLLADADRSARSAAQGQGNVMRGAAFRAFALFLIAPARRTIDGARRRERNHHDVTLRDRAIFDAVTDEDLHAASTAASCGHARTARSAESAFRDRSLTGDARI